MRLIWTLPLLVALAACATDEPPPSRLAAHQDPCAGIQAGGLVDPREPGLLGCTNAVNLRLMIADPSDLSRGVDTTAARDDHAIAAAQAYRLGKTPRLGDAGGYQDAQSASGDKGAN